MERGAWGMHEAGEGEPASLPPPPQPSRPHALSGPLVMHPSLQRAERAEREASSSLVTVSLSPSSLTDHTAAHSSVRRPRSRPLQALLELSLLLLPAARPPAHRLSALTPVELPLTTSPLPSPPRLTPHNVSRSGLTNQVLSGLDVDFWCDYFANFCVLFSTHLTHFL